MPVYNIVHEYKHVQFWQFFETRMVSPKAFLYQRISVAIIDFVLLFNVPSIFYPPGSLLGDHSPPVTSVAWHGSPFFFPILILNSTVWRGNDYTNNELLKYDFILCKIKCPCEYLPCDFAMNTVCYPYSSYHIVYLFEFINNLFG